METQHTTTTHGPMVSFQPEYIRTLPGILKIVEIVLALITFICSCVVGWPGSAWVQFVSISVFLTVLIGFIMYLLNLKSRLPGPHLLIEFIIYCVMTVFFLIAAIVAAAKGGWHESIGASAFFSFATTAVLAVDCFFQFRNWRTGQGDMTTTTTTTTTNVEAGKMSY